MTLHSSACSSSLLRKCLSLLAICLLRPFCEPFSHTLSDSGSTNTHTEGISKDAIFEALSLAEQRMWVTLSEEITGLEQRHCLSAFSLTHYIHGWPRRFQCVRVGMSVSVVCLCLFFLFWYMWMCMCVYAIVRVGLPVAVCMCFVLGFEIKL